MCVRMYNYRYCNLSGNLSEYIDFVDVDTYILLMKTLMNVINVLVIYCVSCAPSIENVSFSFIKVCLALHAFICTM